MALLDDHVPFTRAPGAHEFGPRNIPDGLTTINIRFARCTTASPTLWSAVACEVAAQIWVSVNGGPPISNGGAGYISDDALQLYNAAILGGATPAQAAGQLIAAGKLLFGWKGGVRLNRLGVEVIEEVMKGQLPVGINRVVTGIMGVRGGTFVSERTIEAL